MKPYNKISESLVAALVSQTCVKYHFHSRLPPATGDIKGEMAGDHAIRRMVPVEAAQATANLVANAGLQRVAPVHLPTDIIIDSASYQL